MFTGVVQFFSPVKNFGFICRDDGGPDVFLPGKALARSNLTSVATGTKVSFEIDETLKTGRSDRATSITVID